MTETDLKLTEDEKEALFLAYREDVEAMSMEDLTEALPEDSSVLIQRRGRFRPDAGISFPRADMRSAEGVRG